MKSRDAVRLACEDDAAQIAAIYAPIVTGTWISFETIAPDANEMRRRIAALAGSFPFLCCERDGRIAGYAYASAHRERSAYRFSVDVSAYVHEDTRRSGVARSLYDELFALLSRQGYYNAFAGIALPNDASVGFHRSLGFVDVGRYRNVGYKCGAWRDTLWLQRELHAPGDAPREPIPLSALD